MSRLRGPGWPAAVVLDLVIVLIFAGVGRASHDEADPVLGVLQTAWPFLVGVAVGWAVVRASSGHLPLRVRNGWPVWVSAVAIGMLLRALTGSGTAVPFIIVATIFLGVFLLGWRAVCALLSRKALT